MAGRPRLPVGTFGAIQTTRLGPDRYRSWTRFRDWDGQNRQVTSTASSRNGAITALKADLAQRMHVGDTTASLDAGSPFTVLAEAWLEDLMLDMDRADSTKEIYERELRTLVLPTFEHFTVREVTVSRIERFLKVQRAKSYPRAKHSKTILGMVLGFAVRREIIPRNPVKETTRMKKPPHTPKALTMEQISAIRIAARDWRSAPGTLGPRPDGQVRDLIEVMLGTATRIGETLALRKCDVDMAADPPRVYINGTVIVGTGKGVYRQEHPKTHESNRVLAVPAFAAEVIRHRLALIAGEDAEHLLFISRNGTPLAPNNVRRNFREILKLAGLEEMEITPHAFRRTGATLLANELGIQAAADMLGHTSTSTTKEHYAEPDRTVKSAPAEVLQRLGPDSL
ncbi:tyrosine-type recombinase/integrase [Microterricola viridarii]|uniref:Site-specific recombinase XerD n=1 Tax=Microterricola viridarii TaxID=412690 RepID=A0A1H1VJV0_9MICO|nr:site-specific integrase [Microterricola viridarii]SDS84790.1 Site-specific recombinase XerD [Microterricola viridarii]